MSASERLGSWIPLGARKWTPSLEFSPDGYKIWYGGAPWIVFEENQEIPVVLQILVTLRPAAVERIQEISRNFLKIKKLIRFQKMLQTMVNCIQITSRTLRVDFKQKRCHLECRIS